MSGNYQCNNCGTWMDIVHYVEGSYGNACHSCARSLREARIDKKKYPPPYCWITVKNQMGDDLDAVLLDLVDDDRYEAFVYQEDGESSFERLRFDDCLKPKGKKPHYVIPTRHRHDAERWVKEIEA